MPGPRALNRLSLDLEATLVAKLDRAAHARGCTRSRLIRDVLGLWADKVTLPEPRPVEGDDDFGGIL